MSAFIKSMRGSDVDAALHYLARMLVAGEDARFVARRMVIFASEDVGMADPTALTVATAAAHAVEYVGLPEARLNLAQAVDPPGHGAQVQRGDHRHRGGDGRRAGRARPGRVPRHLRDSHYAGSRGLGHGAGYRYPHDDPRGVVTQQYAPDDVAGREYYRPTGHGAERPLVGSGGKAAYRGAVRRRRHQSGRAAPLASERRSGSGPRRRRQVQQAPLGPGR